MAVAIREPEFTELMPLATLHYEAWSDAYRDVYPDSFTAGRNLDYFHGRWHTFLDDDMRPVLVATADGRLCGFVRYGRPGANSKPQDSAAGEILNMYMLPGFRSRGIGALLLNAAEERLRELGYTCGLLFAAQEMVPSIRFYETNGWNRTGDPAPTDLGGFLALLVRLEKTLTTAP